MFVDSLQSEVLAVIGGLDETVVKRNMAYFHWPVVVLRTDAPTAKVDPFFAPYFQQHTICPFAMSTMDLSVAVPRLWAIEQALELAGRGGVHALLGLKAGSRTPDSRFTRPET
jgi:hypothetical protein